MKRLLKKNLFFIILVILLLPSFWSIAKPGYFPMHDDMQAMRTLEMRKCILDGQIPCRWVPDMGYGYGYPQFNFYGPLPYYFMAALTFLGISIIDSVKVGFIITIPISAISMYLLAREFFNKTASMLAVLFFVYAPYRAVDMYVRGAVGEFWAMSFLPFIFLYTKRVIENKKHATLGLSVFFAFLLMTHNITSLIAAPFFALWAGYFLLQNKSNIKKSIFNLICAVLGGVGLSAFYLLPAWFEKKYVHIDTITMGYFDYKRHFLSLSQLFVRTFWGYGTSDLGPKDELFLGLGMAHIIFAVISLLSLIVLRKSENLKLFIFVLFLFFLSIFMTHSRSNFIWGLFPVLSFVQFPWRFLTLAILFISLLAGLFGDYLKPKLLPLAMVVVFLALFNFSFFKPEKIVAMTDKEKFSGELWDKQQTISIFDYLPIYATEPPNDKAPDGPIVEQGQLLVNSQKRGTDWINYNISVISESAVISLPQYYFPETNLYVNGQKTKFSYDNPLGLPSFTLGRGEYALYLELVDTPIRKIANALTVASVLALVLYWYKFKHV